MPRERGFTLLVLLLVAVVAGASLFLAAAPRDVDPARERAVTDARAVEQARAALLAYALSGRSGSGNKSRPGSLPCVDSDGDLASDGTSCQGGGPYVGRLPVATLDIDPDALAGSDEVWYAIGENFDNFDTSFAPINSGTAPDLEVNGSSGYVAAIILAGDPVAGQSRGSNDPGDHLEGDNVDGDAAFSSCSTDSCNDRVIGVTRQSVLEPVRKLVLGAVREAFVDFLATHGHYPWAAELGDAAGECRNGVDRGTVPVADGTCSASLDGELATWVMDNEWHRSMYYEVADACAPTGSGCTAGPAGLLTLEGATGRAIVFATAGVPLGSQSRSGPAPHDVADYLDSAENTDTPHDGVYDDPPNGPGENDRLRAVAAP